jgi:signal transduction histidine kinase
MQSKSDILKSIYLLYEQTGEYKKAFEYQTAFLLLKDTLLDIEKTRIVSELNIKYEKEQDQAQILALEKENLQKDLNLKEKTLQRNAFLYSGITVLAFATFVFLYINQKRRKDKIIARQKILQLEEEKMLLAAKSLVEGQEEERKRIANELHDGLGVLLSATKMQFSAIRDTNPENISLIKKATQLLEQATGDVRIISHNMMPGLLTRFGLYDAVRDLFDKINDEGVLEATCYIQENLERFPENQEIMLYRIIQEMVNNSLKHAQASNIRLEIILSGDKLEIIFSDNGKGFNVEEMMDSKSLGLKSIRSRVDFLNGKLQIVSNPGQGTRYIIHVDYI